MDSPKYCINQIVVVVAHGTEKEFFDADGQKINFCSNVVGVQGKIVGAQLANITEDFYEWIYEVEVRDDSGELVCISASEIRIEKIITSS